MRNLVFGILSITIVGLFAVSSVQAREVHSQQTNPVKTSAPIHSHHKRRVKTSVPIHTDHTPPVQTTAPIHTDHTPPVVTDAPPPPAGATRSGPGDHRPPPAQPIPCLGNLC